MNVVTGTITVEDTASTTANDAFSVPTSHGAPTPGSFLKTSCLGSPSAAIQVAGTWTGTIDFEGTLDGLYWRPLTGQVIGATTQTQDTTGACAVLFNTAALISIRARASEAITGDALITIIAAAAGIGAVYTLPPT